MTDTPLTPELYDDLLERYVKATAEAETWRDKSAQFHREGVRLKAILSDLRAWLVAEIGDGPLQFDCMGVARPAGG
jgi:hypothetical protein